ncbi:uncharacterized protein LOC144769633 [Lissotriton helveticus]
MRRNDGLTVAKLLLREIIPRFGFPVTIETDPGPHFQNELMQMVCEALDIRQKLHYAYRPEASGVVEQVNGTIKNRIAKMCLATRLKWPDALPLVLMTLRSIPDRKTGISPHEILMGRGMRQAFVPANTLLTINDDIILDYCKNLSDVVTSVFHQVGTESNTKEKSPAHDLVPGDWVRIKVHRRRNCLVHHWQRPRQVILVSTTAVKCARVKRWVHASHTICVPEPENPNEEGESTTYSDSEGELEKGPDTETRQEHRYLEVSDASSASEGEGEIVEVPNSEDQSEDRELVEENTSKDTDQSKDKTGDQEYIEEQSESSESRNENPDTGKEEETHDKDEIPSTSYGDVPNRVKELSKEKTDSEKKKDIVKFVINETVENTESETDNSEDETSLRKSPRKRAWRVEHNTTEQRRKDFAKEIIGLKEMMD